MAGEQEQAASEHIPNVLEELTSTGEGAGLESELAASSIHAPFDPEHIVVSTIVLSVDTLLSRLREGDLLLQPEFQRRANLWDPVRQSQLIESLLLKIPLPSFYFSEDADGVFAVVDGLQRLTAITRFVDVSLLKSLDSSIEPLLLTGLEYLGGSAAREFGKLPRPLQRRIRETQLTIHVIRAATPEAVKFNIFTRLNRGGLPLTAQEIRNALFGTKARETLRRFADSRAFLAGTEGKVSKERMGDQELVLRFIAIYELPRPDANRPENLDDFLNEAMKQVSNWSVKKEDAVFQDFQRAMKAALKIFGRYAFRKYFGSQYARSPINRGLFEAQSVPLAKYGNDKIDKLVGARKEILAQLAGAMNQNDEFMRALSYGTGSASASRARIKTMRDIYRQVLDA